jgi:hypothetical protein
MPAFDQCHDQVVRAFENDGWTLIKSPLRVWNTVRSVFIDAQFERGHNGTREHMLLVEIKCFNDPNRQQTDLYTAIGQYLIYRAMLRSQNIPMRLYLSVPSASLKTQFDSAVMDVMQRHDIQLVIVSLETERIEQWIP